MEESVYANDEEPPVNEEEYLAPNSQEDDIPEEDANPDNKSDCELDSKQYLYDTTYNTFPKKKELYDAIIAMKNDINKDIFQSGPPEKVHDTELLNNYVDLIGSIWKSIVHNIPIELENYSEKIKSAIHDFLTTLDLHLKSTENNQETNLMRTRFLKLHLHCFPYCLNHTCLAYD